MKYFISFILLLLFIAPVVDDDKTFSEVFRGGIYSYITCVDGTVNYLVSNIPVLSKIAERPYLIAYDNVMQDRRFTKHLVGSGETLDDIIKDYNTKIENIEDFRKVVYKENPDIVSRSYEIKSGDYITIPTDYL